MRLSPERSAELVQAAAAGDPLAWRELVDAYVALIWKITMGHRLSVGDAADVSQTTWLRLLENIDRLQDPSRVGAWLATTARRECLRVLGQSRRCLLTSDDNAFDGDGDAVPPVDAAILAHERDDAVRDAVRRLPPRCQELLSLLMMDPPPSYEEIAAALDMPIGSIGPTRGRCLKRLNDMLADTGIREGSRGISQR